MDSFLAPGAHKVEIASLCLAGILLVATLLLHLLPALFAGLMTFVLIHALSNRMAGRLSSRRGKLLAVTLIALAVVGGLCAIGFSIFTLLKADAGLSGLFDKMALVLDDASMSLPASLVENFPSGAEEIRAWFVHWLRGHSSEMQLAGKLLGVGVAHVLIGMVIGVLVALHEASGPRRSKPLAQFMLLRVRLLVESFRKVVFAQIRIALINTLLTALYLCVILPLAGIHLPFLKTMIALTFILGLLPVLGNLLSNAIIIIVSVSYSLHVSLASLLFLITIHKLEYFLNAHIVGSQIRAQVWELLLAMLLMESLFGLSGVVAAPVFYAYLKRELELQGLI